MGDLFLRACRKEPVERVPVWLMRQAGRYLPEYRAVRERVDFLTLCGTPDLAAEVTLQPVERLGVDAAILFSDILVAAAPMGIAVAFDPGPRLTPAVRTARDVARLRVFDPEEELTHVYRTIRLVRGALSGRVPLIGFAAAPFTLAAYLVEGGGSSGFESLRGLLHADPALAHRLLEKVSEVTVRHLAAQARAGAQAVQLFDSWAGLLALPAYREFGLRYAARVLEELEATGVPRIYFALHAAHLLEAIGEGCPAEVVGVDWRMGLAEASARLGGRVVVQGNLDPAALLAPPDAFEPHVHEVLRQGAQAPGHVFNLGHGVLPSTPVEHVQSLVEAVHRAGVVPAAGSSSR